MVETRHGGDMGEVPHHPLFHSGSGCCSGKHHPGSPQYHTVVTTFCSWQFCPQAGHGLSGNPSCPYLLPLLSSPASMLTEETTNKDVCHSKRDMSFCLHKDAKGPSQSSVPLRQISPVTLPHSGVPVSVLPFCGHFAPLSSV